MTKANTFPRLPEKRSNSGLAAAHGRGRWRQQIGSSGIPIVRFLGGEMGSDIFKGGGVAQERLGKKRSRPRFLRNLIEIGADDGRLILSQPERGSGGPPVRAPI